VPAPGDDAAASPVGVDRLAKLAIVVGSSAARTRHSVSLHRFVAYVPGAR